MSAKKRLITVLVLLMLAGCASDRPVRLNQDYLKRDGLVIGVALSKIPRPDVKVGFQGAEPGLQYPWTFPPGGGTYNPSGKPDEQTRFEDLGRYDASKREPTLRSDALTLENEISARLQGVLKDAQEGFVKGLGHPGRRVIMIREVVGEVIPGAAYLDGMDAVVILDYTWYGVRCHYTDLEQDTTDAGAELKARMVDLKTLRLLWQAPEIRIMTPVSCGCGQPDCFPGLSSAVRQAVHDAGAAALKNLLGKTP